MKRMLGSLVLAVLAVLGGLSLMLFLMQERMLFLPNLPGRELRATPADIGLDFEDVALTTSDGLRLHAWYVPAPGARLTLLHFHGNAGNIGDRVELLALWRGLGVNVLLLDYRGYGRSEGRPSEAGTYRDASAAWEYLTRERRLARDTIVLHGQSLGGAVAADLATRVAPAGLVLESSFTSVPDVAAELYPFLPVRALSRLRYDTLARMAQIRCPVLVIHSRDDEIIGYRNAERLFAAAREPKRMVTLQGDHNAGVFVSAGAYVHGLREFLSTL